MKINKFHKGLFLIALTSAVTIGCKDDEVGKLLVADNEIVTIPFPKEVFAGDTVMLVDNTKRNFISRNWSFGDAETPTSAVDLMTGEAVSSSIKDTVIVAFTTVGKEKVTINSKFAGGESLDKTGEIEISSPVEASLSLIEKGAKTKFNLNKSFLDKYQSILSDLAWQFYGASADESSVGNANVAIEKSGINPEVTYSLSGQFDVKLILKFQESAQRADIELLIPNMITVVDKVIKSIGISILDENTIALQFDEGISKVNDDPTLIRVTDNNVKIDVSSVEISSDPKVVHLTLASALTAGFPNGHQLRVVVPDAFFMSEILSTGTFSTSEAFDRSIENKESFSTAYMGNIPTVRVAGVTTIWAAQYDTKGAGVSYNDTTPGNTATTPNNVRGDDVDIEGTGDAGDANIGHGAAGEWLNYTINVEQAGKYDITLNLSSGNDGKKVQLVKTDDTAITPEITVDNSGWVTYKDYLTTAVDLEAGEQIIRFKWVTENVNFKSIKIQTHVAAPTVSTGPLVFGSAADTESDDIHITFGTEVKTAGAPSNYTVEIEENAGMGDYRAVTVESATITGSANNIIALAIQEVVSNTQAIRLSIDNSDDAITGADDSKLANVTNEVVTQYNPNYIEIFNDESKTTHPWSASPNAGIMTIVDTDAHTGTKSFRVSKAAGTSGELGESIAFSLPDLPAYKSTEAKYEISYYWKHYANNVKANNSVRFNGDDTRKLDVGFWAGNYNEYATDWKKVIIPVFSPKATDDFSNLFIELVAYGPGDSVHDNAYDTWALHKIETTVWTTP